MTEYTHLIEEAKQQEAFREWRNYPRYIHAQNGKIEIKYQDGRTEIENTSTGQKTYNFPKGYEGQPYKEKLFDRFLKIFTE